MTPEQIEGLEAPAYLIRKGGVYYRPNERGYTSSAILAGRYTQADAERITHPNGQDGPRDGMSYAHMDEISDPDGMEFRTLARHVLTQQAQITALAEDAARAHDLALEVARLKALVITAEAERDTAIDHANEGWKHAHHWKDEYQSSQDTLNIERALSDGAHRRARRAELANTATPRDTHAATAAVLSARDSIPDGE